jgi:hypothetical protein
MSAVGKKSVIKGLYETRKGLEMRWVVTCWETQGRYRLHGSE